MPREIFLAMNAHNQHWELSMATNLETVLMKIRPPHLGLVVMHVILGNGFSIYSHIDLFHISIIKMIHYDLNILKVGRQPKLLQTARFIS